MFSMSAVSLTCYILVFGALSSCRPAAHPFDMCNSESAYSGAFSCYELIDSRGKSILSNHPTLSQQDLQRIREACSDPYFAQGGRLPGSRVEKSSSRIIDIEVPLSSTYLMSLAPSESSRESVEREKLGQERHSRIEASTSEEELGEGQYLLCPQKSDETPVIHQHRENWDQDRSMNVVVGIVIMFWAVVTIAELTEMITKMSV